MMFGNTFASLRHRNFRLFWTGQLVSLVGTWMQNIAQGWLVLTLTNSAFLLGLVSAIGSLPVLLLALPGGVAADRANKRNLLLVTQAIAMVLAFVLAALTYLRVVQVWHVVLLAAIGGSVFAFDAPSRQAFIIELVGKDDLLNAIALNSAIFNAARILGPAMAGVLIGVIGMAGCFFLNGISFLAVIAGLSLIRSEYAATPRRSSPWQDMRSGLQYVGSNRDVLYLEVIVAAFSIFGMPYAVLMPIIAKNVLGVGAAGLGFLMTATGVGALVGALSLAAFGKARGRGRLVLVAGTAFSVLLAAFSFSRNFFLSLALLPFIGWAMVSQVATINTILQSIVPDDIRGRVMSVHTLMFMGLTPFGSFIAGSVAQRWGAPTAILAGALACLACTVAVFTRRPELRAL